ncbi:MAG: DUF1499 domain-containing protein [Proteobacteria bacterium]|nr:DUF1499 domain-containing protein [Pseudomonadota bacterium]MBU1387397.1 DUF1499 domain-containing protein [Pseudomonadota bacterium]MBU1541682.1 DUF1499 domain-containing protein [Pseudomonadota bacterium]MBU2482014.1 DUF1499 domain-containing protein [Pseudomonadota bacterium]
MVVAGIGLLIIGCPGKRPKTIGLMNKSLYPCPESPNCVSSMTDSKSHFIPALSYKTDKQKAYEVLVNLLSVYPGAAIISQTDDYLYVEFKSRLFRFVDDVEFYFPEGSSLIHVRSASRLGYSDMNVNRKRLENIRRQFEDALNASS